MQESGYGAVLRESERLDFSGSGEEPEAWERLAEPIWRHFAFLVFLSWIPNREAVERRRRVTTEPQSYLMHQL